MGGRLDKFFKYSRVGELGFTTEMLRTRDERPPFSSIETKSAVSTIRPKNSCSAAAQFLFADRQESRRVTATTLVGLGRHVTKLVGNCVGVILRRGGIERRARDHALAEHAGEVKRAWFVVSRVRDVRRGIATSQDASPKVVQARRYHAANIEFTHESSRRIVTSSSVASRVIERRSPVSTKPMR